MFLLTSAKNMMKKYSIYTIKMNCINYCFLFTFSCRTVLKLTSIITKFIISSQDYERHEVSTWFTSTAIATEDLLHFSIMGAWKSLIALLLTMTTVGFTVLVLAFPHLPCWWRFLWKQLFITVSCRQDRPRSINRANLCEGHRGQNMRPERSSVSEFLMRLNTTDGS